MRLFLQYIYRFYHRAQYTTSALTLATKHDFGDYLSFLNSFYNLQCNGTLDLLHKSSLALKPSSVEVNEMVLLQEVYYIES